MHGATIKILNMLSLLYDSHNKQWSPIGRLWKYTVLSEAGSKSMYCYNGDKFSLDTIQSHPLIGVGAPNIAAVFRLTTLLSNNNS